MKLSPPVLPDSEDATNTLSINPTIKKEKDKCQTLGKLSSTPHPETKVVVLGSLKSLTKLCEMDITIGKTDTADYWDMGRGAPGLENNLLGTMLTT